MSRLRTFAGYPSHAAHCVRCSGGLAKAGKPTTVKRGKLIGARPEFLTLIATRSPKLAAKIHKWFRKEAKRVAAAIVELGRLDKLAKQQTISQADIDLIIQELNLEGWIALAGIITDDLGEIFKKAGIEGLDMVGIETDEKLTSQLDVRAAQWAADKSTELMTLADSTREELRGVIADAVENGYGVDELSEAVEDSFAFSQSRAMTIARTELASAHIQGNMSGWKESGVVEQKQSILGSEHDMDDICDDNADQGPIPLDEEFESGDIAPPYHPNCVCDLLPITSEETDQEQSDGESSEDDDSQEKVNLAGLLNKI